MTRNDGDNFFSSNIFRSILCVAALLVAAFCLFGEDESDFVPGGRPPAAVRSAPDPASRGRRPRPTADAWARQQYAAQQYARQLMLRRALIQQMQQQQAMQRRQQGGSGSFLHRGYGGGTGGDGETFYAIGKGWSYIR